jgi:hypothetical protein
VKEASDAVKKPIRMDILRVREGGGLQGLRPREGGGLRALAAMGHGSAPPPGASEDREDSRAPMGRGIVWARGKKPCVSFN